MTVKRYREIFKEKAAHLSDEEIRGIIALDSSLIRNLIHQIVEKRLPEIYDH